MADVIFIQILRAYLARVPDDGGGFLGALRDPSTAAALAAMHHRAEAPWTVASLAEEVGLSRSVFAARFTQLVGEPPLGYLTRLRMQKAATLLRDGASLTEASRLTGYASQASFGHAFRQWAGVAPGTYRKQPHQVGKKGPQDSLENTEGAEQQPDGAEAPSEPGGGPGAHPSR